MYFLFQIYFQSGDFYNEPGSFWTDLFISIVGAALGAFLGICGAWKLYLVQVNRDREDNLKYNASLIRSVVGKIGRQAENCTTYAKENFGNSTDVPLLHFQLFEDLVRLVERVDQQKFFPAFLHRFKRNADTFKTFKEIYTNLDFCLESIAQIKDYLEKEQQSLVSKKKEYVKLLDDAEEMMAILSIRKIVLLN